LIEQEEIIDTVDALKDKIGKVFPFEWWFLLKDERDTQQECGHLVSYFNKLLDR